MMYKPGQPEKLVLWQGWIKARDIDMTGWEIGPKDFPWHGFKEENFDRLNKKLQDARAEIYSIETEKQADKFAFIHSDVYDAYFRQPIQVRKSSGDLPYEFCKDGRHRIYAAQKTDSYIPVFSVGYFEVRKLPFEEFVNRDWSSGWRFEPKEVELVNRPIYIAEYVEPEEEAAAMNTESYEKKIEETTEAHYAHLIACIGDIDLAESEKSTLEWLKGCEWSTLDNLASIILKVYDEGFEEGYDNS
jgi:hypothetical protein